VVDSYYGSSQVDMVKGDRSMELIVAARKALDTYQRRAANAKARWNHEQYRIATIMADRAARLLAALEKETEK